MNHQNPYLIGKKNFFIRTLVIGLIFAQAAITNAVSSEKIKIPEGKSAWEVWSLMTRSSLTHEPIEFQISQTAGVISFGGEKEGGDALITRIMSPTADDFKKITKSIRSDLRQKMLADFLNGVSRGRYSINEVTTAEGAKLQGPKTIPVKQYGKMKLNELEKTFDQWLSQTHDRPFAFLTPDTRVKIYYGTLPGMSEIDWIDRGMRVYPRAIDASRSTDPIPTHFNSWKPIFGEPEKYISRMVTELLGDWELNFKPQKSFGEFERMMSWFRETLQYKEGDYNPYSEELRPYNAFGHQWVVLPKKEIHGASMKALVQNKLAEVYKVTQALITLRGIEMNSGILTSMYNEVRSDALLRKHETERSIMRLKGNLFKSNTGAAALNIEQRSGTSYNPTRRFVQQSIVSRYYSDDWSGLANSKDYVLVPENPDEITRGLSKRFGVTEFEANRALSRIQSIVFEGDEEVVKGLRSNSLAPFWNWDQAPFLSQTKKDLVKRVTKNFIQQLAAIPDGSAPKIQESVFQEFARWTAITNIDTDIEVYLMPKPKHIPTQKFGQYETRIKAGAVDVNQFEFGVEYTTRFPLRPTAEFTEEKLKLGKRGFIQLEYDLTPDEKRTVIYDIAKKLAKKLNGRDIEPTRVDAAGHGHKIAITYEIPHPRGGTWRVEWDGIGRDYDLAGNVLTGSERGGVVEIVTPKMNPTEADIKALYQVFDELGIHPSYYSGGGHINFDLAVFDGKPKQMARFIALFLTNRDVITAMTQYPGRFPTAEPHSISEAFIEKLLKFNGTEEELKKLLYNEKFFNTRMGRKTKYVQMELSSYFQDVIPEEFISKDFDIKNDVWRKQFRVNPNIRKGEFRLFGAPRNLEEAHLQIKLVRAMMNSALNENTPITKRAYTQSLWVPAHVDDLAKNPKALFSRFEEMMRDLKLDANEYKGLFAEGMREVDQYRNSAFYEPYEKKMTKFQTTEGWKKAVAARPPEKAINYKDRVFDERLAEAEALKLKQERTQVLRETIRERTNKGVVLPMKQTWRVFDEGTVAEIKQLKWPTLMKYPSVATDYVIERYIEKGNWSEGIKKLTEIAETNANYSQLIKERLSQSENQALTSTQRVHYWLAIQDPKTAAETLNIALKNAPTDDLNLLLQGLTHKPIGFQVDLASDIETRRATYVTRGIQYETLWGDVIERTIQSKNYGPTEQYQLTERLLEMLKKNELSLGSQERELLHQIRESALKSEFNFVKNPALKNLGRLIKQKCTPLLLANP